MNLEEARKRAHGYSVSRHSDERLVAKLSRDVLELVDEVERLRKVRSIAVDVEAFIGSGVTVPAWMSAAFSDAISDSATPREEEA